MKWKFRMDKENVAEKEDWNAPSFDDTEWTQINVPAFGGWSKQGQGVAGTGWYRMRYAVPEALRKKHIYLHFGADDEQAWVYLDRTLTVEHTTGSTGYGAGTLWTQPFHVEVSNLMGDGAEHTLAVRVGNNWGAGGLYEPVHMIASDTPMDAEPLFRAAKQKNK